MIFIVNKIPLNLIVYISCTSRAAEFQFIFASEFIFFSMKRYRAKKRERDAKN